MRKNHLWKKQSINFYFILQGKKQSTVHGAYAMFFYRKKKEKARDSASQYAMETTRQATNINSYGQQATNISFPATKVVIYSDPSKHWRILQTRPTERKKLVSFLLASSYQILKFLSVALNYLLCCYQQEDRSGTQLNFS